MIKRRANPAEIKRTALFWALGWICLILALVPSSTAQAAVGCSLSDPEGDLRRFFPDLTDFTINYVSFSVQNPEGHPLLAKKLQDPLDPVYETPDVPYTLYTVRKNGTTIGYVFGANQRGTYSNIQVIAITDPALHLIDVYLQKIRSPDYEAFQSEPFRKSLANIPFENYPQWVGCYRDGKCEKAQVKDPSQGRQSKDFQHIVRALAKLRILSEILLHPGKVVQPDSPAALAQWVSTQWVPERGFRLIDEPHFVSAAQAKNTFMAGENEVLVWPNTGMTRIYPLSILSQHPVVHDTVNGKSVIIAWSSASRTALILDKARTDQAVTFSNTSQALFGHQLIMDVKTQSIWSPVLSRAIQGPRSGETMAPLPGGILMGWEMAQTVFPQALVLAPPDGFSPFEDTYQAHRLRYPPASDDRLVIRSEEAQTTLSLEELGKKKVHSTQIGETPIVIFAEENTFAPFIAQANNRRLTFEKDIFEETRKAWLYRDQETKSLWVGLRGEAIEGPLKGARLKPVVSFQLPQWTWAHLYGP